jgi:hypothetical protein
MKKKKKRKKQNSATRRLANILNGDGNHLKPIRANRLFKG